MKMSRKMLRNDIAAVIDDLAFDFNPWDYYDYAETREDGKRKVEQELRTEEGRSAIIEWLTGIAGEYEDYEDVCHGLINEIERLYE